LPDPQNSDTRKYTVNDVSSPFGIMQLALAGCEIYS